MYIPKWAEDKTLGGINGYGFTALLVSGICIFIILIGLLSWKIESRNCHVAEIQYHKGTHYFFLGGGCYIETEPGIKIRLEQFQNFKQVK